MIPVEALPQPGTAYQFLESTAAELSKLVLPTGPVTVQFPDALNRTEGRCYVMTTWGTATLSEGDWIVVYDVGVVVTITAEQFPLFYEMREGATLFSLTAPEEVPEGRSMRDMVDTQQSARQAAQMAAVALGGMSPALSVSRASEVVSELPKPPVFYALRLDTSQPEESWGEVWAAYVTRYRLDYTLDELRETRQRYYRVFVNATGREVLRFDEGDVVLGTPDGELVIEGPAVR